MIKFGLQDFFRLTTFLKSVEHLIQTNIQGAASPIGEGAKEILDRQFGGMLALCNEMGLELSAMQVQRIKDMAQPDAIYQKLLEPLKQLEDRIRDEVNVNLYMLIPRNKVGFYNNAVLFGPEVLASFQPASFDIEEAGNCFATGRNTACVMHLMRALEVALDAVGLGVGMPNVVVDAKNSWGSLLTAIAKQMDANDKAGDSAWPPKRQFFVDAHAHLFAVKNGWRNPSMHLEKKYDEQEAERIYRAVKDFMEHLATHLDASGQFTP